MLRAGIAYFLLCCALGSRAGAGETPAATAPDREAFPQATAGERGLAPADFARALLDETNRVRRAHGRRPLRAKPELAAAADDQAAFMALTMQVQHESFLPDQATSRDRVRRHGLTRILVTENVAVTPVTAAIGRVSARDIAAVLVEQWLNSPGHRENLLNPRLTHFGGAVRLARPMGHWSAYGVQVFAIETASTGRLRAGPVERYQTR